MFFCKSFYLNFLSLKKLQKRPSHSKNSRSVLLLVPHTASTRSNLACHSNPVCFEQGAAKLASHDYIRKIIPALRSNSLAQWPALNRDLRSIFDGAGFIFEITLVREIYCPPVLGWTIARQIHCLSLRFSHTKVIPKTNRHGVEQQRVSVPIEEKEQKCLSVCAIRCR